MPIGEFWAAPPALPGERQRGADVRRCTGCMRWGQASLNPARGRDRRHQDSVSRIRSIRGSHTEFGKSIAAGCELFRAHQRRRYGKPEWGPARYRGQTACATPGRNPAAIWEKPFCRLLYFDRKLTRPAA